MEDKSYYLSQLALTDCEFDKLPKSGLDRSTAKEIISSISELDFAPTLNTSSYVNVKSEEEEQDILLMGMKVNLADQTVYPNAYKIHDKVVNILGNLWNCPDQETFKESGTFPGAGAVGSTEACLLGGLALKFRWRKWYAEQNNMSSEEVLAVRPNLIISSCFQAAWEKLFRYMDIEPRIITASSKDFTIDPSKLAELVDDKTIGVVCIMGNHWGGHYDPVWDVNDIIEKINAQNNFQVGIHVDAASGGFIAPFQKDLPAWDFRLKNVLSISSSGHKYGESCPGTGWILWRHKKDLSEHVAISVTYLGGKSDSYTLNFSRPASGPFVQYYKLIRFGFDGYQALTDNMMKNASFLRDELRKMQHNCKPRFLIMDHGDKGCLPVVTARLNPECNLPYNDIDLQHALSQHHWYVSGYKMGYNHPITEESIPLFNNEDKDSAMFRVVIKSNVTRTLLNDLVAAFKESLEFLDEITEGGGKIDTRKLRNKNNRTITNHC